jgi:hypothetical protein
LNFVNFFNKFLKIFEFNFAFTFDRRHLLINCVIGGFHGLHIPEMQSLIVAQRPFEYQIAIVNEVGLFLFDQFVNFLKDINTVLFDGLID